jgi:hypothetical protein
VSAGRTSVLRVAVLATALVGLLSLVALASRAGLPWGSTTAAAEGRSLAVLGRIAADLVLVAFAALLVGVLVLQIRRPQLGVLPVPEDDAEDEGERAGRLARLLARALPYALLALVVVLTFLFAREIDRRFPRPEPATTAPGGGAPADPSAAPASDTASWLLTTAGVLALVGILAAVAVPAALRRRAAREAEQEEARAVAVSRILDESIDDLWSEPDPRRAVIAAYARMERGLSARGHGRRPFEAPAEYLRRVLADLGADREAAGRLTALFERAKFSRQEVGAEERAAAIRSLADIRGGVS